LAEAVAPFTKVFVVEDHAPVGGLGDAVLRELATASMLDGRALTPEWDRS
jgi:transketolase C-terminal domain/subunit